MDIESKCSVCNRNLRTDEFGDITIQVDDPQFHDLQTPDDWRHLHCWDAAHPSIVTLFRTREHDLMLSTFFAAMAESDTTILKGFNAIECLN